VLHALTDYQLKDIGIGSRSDIRRMICEYQKK